MLTATVEDCKTLEDFYTSIRKQQEEAHGEHYCAHHDEISKLIKNLDLKIYKELGTHQGASAAAAILAGASSVSLVDITMERFNKSRHLFETYCDEHGIELEVLETDSTAANSASLCDIMLVDSVHRPDHMLRELEVHAPNVGKYMVFHDTERQFGKIDRRLYDALKEYSSGMSRWSLVLHNDQNVGYTVLQRMH